MDAGKLAFWCTPVFVASDSTFDSLLGCTGLVIFRGFSYLTYEDAESLEKPRIEGSEEDSYLGKRLSEVPLDFEVFICAFRKCHFLLNIIFL